MSIRFCPRCNSEVSETGGFCLLGHNLAHEAPTASLNELRAEVDKAFAEAEVHVQEALAPLGPPAPPAPTTTSTLVRPLPPPPKPRTAPTEVHAGEPQANDPIVAFAPPPRMDWGPDRPGLLRRRPARN